MTRLILVAGIVALAACQSDEPARGELTKRQSDSAIGASGLPGAQGVTRAMSAADSAAARNARLDSAATEP